MDAYGSSEDANPPRLFINWTVLQQLLLAASSYVAPERRDATLHRTAEALWRLAQAAEAGADRQFQFLKAFAQLADTIDAGRVDEITIERINGDPALEARRYRDDLVQAGFAMVPQGFRKRRRALSCRPADAEYL